MPGSIGWQGLVVILLIALIIFGPKRLPEMGRSLGRGMREFKDSITGNDKDDDDFDRARAPARRERAGRLRHGARARHHSLVRREIPAAPSPR